MHTISPEDIIERNQKKFLANKLGDEIVMMNLENGNFVSMNNVGANIWDLLEHPLPVATLVERLTKVYDITEQQCLEETINFLQQSTVADIFIVQKNG